MLQVTLVVRPQRAEVLCQRLLAAGWIDELHACEVRGYGRQKGHLDHYEGDEYRIDFLPKVLVTGVIDVGRLDEFLALAMGACRTGRIGDGKVFVRQVESVLEY